MNTLYLIAKQAVDSNGAWQNEVLRICTTSQFAVDFVKKFIEKRNIIDYNEDWVEYQYRISRDNIVLKDRHYTIFDSSPDYGDPSAYYISIFEIFPNHDLEDLRFSKFLNPNKRTCRVKIAECEKNVQKETIEE